MIWLEIRLVAPALGLSDCMYAQPLRSLGQATSQAVSSSKLPHSTKSAHDYANLHTSENRITPRPAVGLGGCAVRISLLVAVGLSASWPQRDLWLRNSRTWARSCPFSWVTLKTAALALKQTAGLNLNDVQIRWCISIAKRSKRGMQIE